jgi:hypothetical protein
MVDMRKHNVTRSPLAAVALTAALTAGAVAASTAPAISTASAAGPCGPLGNLVEFTLNDRCDYGTGRNPMNVGDKAIVAALRRAGLFATRIRCANGAVVPVVAAPNQLLITADSPGRLNFALQITRRRLINQVEGEPRPVNALAAVQSLRPGTLTPEFMTSTVPRLQGQGFSVDLNYLEPAMPNNRFHPFDNPTPAKAAPAGRGGRGGVLVVDSPPNKRLYGLDGRFGPTVNYDLDGNRLVDEDHSHGVFVATLVKRYAPSAKVYLAGVRGRQVPGLARWTPMLFSDADLIKAMGAAFELSPGGTAVRRSFNVVNLSLGGAGCEGIADRLPLGRFMRDLAAIAGKTTGITPWYVAAAGNDGADVKHFPAAWRDTPTIQQAADAVALSDPAAAGEILQIHNALRRRTIAVGSWRAGVKDSFSNCGTWVNGIARGAKAVSRYPSPTTKHWAKWSGTSFATPQVSARLVGGNPGGVARGASIGACPP